MSTYNIGFIIKSLRVLMGITQEGLADDIIDVSGLKRLENGNRMPEKRKLEALFQRLGVNPNNLTTIFITNDITSQQKITDQLDVQLRDLNVDAATASIQTLEEMAKTNKLYKDKLFDRYLMAAKVANDINAGNYNLTESIEMLEKTMKLHYPRYNHNRIANYYLTMTDFRILLMLGLLYCNQNNTDRGIKILYDLKENTEKNITDRIERGRRYPNIIYNLTHKLMERDEYKEVIKLCRQGHDVCIETESLMLLPDIIIQEANANYYIKNYDECIQLFLAACYTYKLYGQYEKLEKTKDYVKNQFNIVLDEMMHPKIVST